MKSTTKSKTTSIYTPSDYYNIDDLLSEEHLLIRQSVRDWLTEHAVPYIDEWAQNNHCPIHLTDGMGEMGMFGPFIPTAYGGPGLDQISYGLIMQEIERVDSGLRSMSSVQSSLVMWPIFTYGTEAQKHKYLPGLAKGEIMGCFGLT